MEWVVCSSGAHAGLFDHSLRECTDCDMQPVTPLFLQMDTPSIVLHVSKESAKFKFSRSPHPDLAVPNWAPSSGLSEKQTAR